MALCVRFPGIRRACAIRVGERGSRLQHSDGRKGGEELRT